MGRDRAGLVVAGFRMIAPDQVGFRKPSEPQGYQSGFHAMADLTRGLLDRIGAGRVILVGRSTGDHDRCAAALSRPPPRFVDAGGFCGTIPDGLGRLARTVGRIAGFERIAPAGAITDDVVMPPGDTDPGAMPVAWGSAAFAAPATM